MSDFPLAVDKPIPFFHTEFGLGANIDETQVRAVLETMLSEDVLKQLGTLTIRDGAVWIPCQYAYTLERLINIHAD